MVDTEKVVIACSECRTRYRVDASRLTGRAANFKCAKCGHVFPLRVPEVSRDERAPWLVTVAGTGEERAMPSLDTVKRLIIEGSFGAQDVLSRAGRKGKPLGEIEQFAPFLRVRERSGAYSLSEEDGQVDGEELEASLEAEEGGQVQLVEGDLVTTGELASVADNGAAAGADEDHDEDVAGPETDAPAAEEDAKSPAAKPPAAKPPAAKKTAAKVPPPKPSGRPAGRRRRASASRDEQGLRLDSGFEQAVYTDVVYTDEHEIAAVSKANRRMVVISLVLVLAGLVALVIALYYFAPETFEKIFPFMAQERPQVDPYISPDMGQ